MRICVSPRIQEYFGHALVRGEWTRTWRPVTSRTVAGRGRRVPAASGPTASAALRLLLLRVEQQLPALLLARRLVVAVDGGVFLKYHNWRRFLDHYLREAFGELLLRQNYVD